MLDFLFNALFSFNVHINSPFAFDFHFILQQTKLIIKLKPLQDKGKSQDFFYIFCKHIAIVDFLPNKNRFNALVY